MAGVGSDSDNLDELFGDDVTGGEPIEEVVIDVEQSPAIDGDPVSDPELIAETPLEPIDEPSVIDEPVTEGELVSETPPAATPGDLDGLFGDGTELATTDALQNQVSPRELRWELPSQRVDGSQLSRQEVKAIELWGGPANQQLQKWATLAPSTQYYNLSQAPKGVYRFALVTVDQDGLRSDPSAPVIRDLR